MDLSAEWLETDGTMGFASGTVSGRRTRRYHGLLLVPTARGRVVLVGGVEVWLETPAGTFGLSTQVYREGVIHPRGEELISDFTTEPWPTWTFQTPSGHTVSQEILLRYGGEGVLLRWKLIAGDGPVPLHVKPLLAARDYHGLQRKNDAFQFDAEVKGNQITWKPYADRPAIFARSNGEYEHAPEWVEQFEYAHEADRGLDTLEDLAKPGEFHFWQASGRRKPTEASEKEALLIFSTRERDEPALSMNQLAESWEHAEQKRRLELGGPLERAADAYITWRGESRTIIAGYPWFTDWGRDTLIALRGLCLATKRLDVAEEILCSWAETVSEGMLPNRFPDHGENPEFNSVDASLWYVIAVGEFLEECERCSRSLSRSAQSKLKTAVTQILTGYKDGTRYRIGMDADGLIAAGEPGVQLTWMDAKVGDWVVTPRIGKPVEIQALWINALAIGYDVLPDGADIFETACGSFRRRFWNPEKKCLFDVVDCDHNPGVVDDSVRPNQILAVGGLPMSLVDDDQSRLVVAAVEEQLWTPLGLRSLTPDDENYRGRYEGDVWKRDGAYHQGTVWAWLIGPFVEAWFRSKGETKAAREEAERRFLLPLEEHLHTAGLGHISEIADGDPPHIPRGCPFQAWSLGEYLRLKLRVLK